MLSFRRCGDLSVQTELDGKSGHGMEGAALKSVHTAPLHWGDNRGRGHRLRRQERSPGSRTVAGPIPPSAASKRPWARRLNPRLLPTCWSAPCTAANRPECLWLNERFGERRCINADIHHLIISAALATPPRVVWQWSPASNAVSQHRLNPNQEKKQLLIYSKFSFLMPSFVFHFKRIRRAFNAVNGSKRNCTGPKRVFPVTGEFPLGGQCLSESDGDGVRWSPGGGPAHIGTRSKPVRGGGAAKGLPLFHQQDRHEDEQDEDQNPGADSGDLHHAVRLLGRVGDDLRFLRRSWAHGEEKANRNFKIFVYRVESERRGRAL